MVSILAISFLLFLINEKSFSWPDFTLNSISINAFFDSAILSINSSSIEFKEVEPGVYQGTTVLTSEDVGRFNLDLNAVDAYGNLGSADFEFEVSGMSLIRQLEVMSPVIILLLIALGIASFFAWRF